MAVAVIAPAANAAADPLGWWWWLQNKGSNAVSSAGRTDTLADPARFDAIFNVSLNFYPGKIVMFPGILTGEEIGRFNIFWFFFLCDT